MQFREPQAWPGRLGPLNIAVFLTGTALLLVGLSFDWVHLLKIVRFPAGELNNPWVRADLATLRGVCITIAIASDNFLDCPLETPPSSCSVL